MLPFPASGEDFEHEWVQTKYIAHVAGVELSTESAMFASKDHGVSACATIATWLATDLLHRRHDLQTCSSTEITLRAIGADPEWSRPLPQYYGLDTGQILRALMSLDYSPHIYFYDPLLGGNVEREHSWIGLLYGYILSHLPVVITCDMDSEHHAILAVGMNIQALSPEGTLTTDRIKSFSRTVKGFIVHDDRYGGFGILTPGSKSASGLPTDNVEASITYPDGAQRRITVRALIVPLPPQVNILSGQAHRLGARAVQSMISHFAAGEAPERISYQGPFQTRLITSTELKKDAYKWTGLSEQALKAVVNLPMPKYVWVTEAYPRYARIPSDSQPFARVILDATQLTYGGEALRLGGHLQSAWWPGK